MSWHPPGRSDTPLLKPEELFEKRRTRDASRLRAYNTILEQIYSRIRTISQMGVETFFVFSVPPFILGLPKLDLEDCIVYLVYMMRQQKYEVRYTYPNMLYISWKHHEKEYLLKNSPIMQAMLPLAPAAVKKATNQTIQSSREQISYANQERSQRQFMGGGYNGGNGNGNGNGNGYNERPRVRFNDPMQNTLVSQQSQQRAVPRNVGDYEPPASFLNAIEKPPVNQRRDVMNDLAFF
jgi:hypothetical protein